MCVSIIVHRSSISLFFFFNDTATTEIYTLSLHDALPIFPPRPRWVIADDAYAVCGPKSACHTTSQLRRSTPPKPPDRKSTRLNSSHSQISYAVFCLKKKNNNSDLPHT